MPLKSRCHRRHRRCGLADRGYGFGRFYRRVIEHDLRSRWRGAQECSGLNTNGHRDDEARCNRNHACATPLGVAFCHFPNRCHRALGRACGKLWGFEGRFDHPKFLEFQHRYLVCTPWASLGMCSDELCANGVEFSLDVRMEVCRHSLALSRRVEQRRVFRRRHGFLRLFFARCPHSEQLLPFSNKVVDSIGVDSQASLDFLVA